MIGKCDEFRAKGRPHQRVLAGTRFASYRSVVALL